MNSAIPTLKELLIDHWEARAGHLWHRLFSKRVQLTQADRDATARLYKAINDRISELYFPERIIAIFHGGPFNGRQEPMQRTEQRWKFPVYDPLQDAVRFQPDASFKVESNIHHATYRMTDRKRSKDGTEYHHFTFESTT
jgi:hypothetical protein